MIMILTIHVAFLLTIHISTALRGAMFYIMSFHVQDVVLMHDVAFGIGTYYEVSEGIKRDEVDIVRLQA